MKDQVLWVYTTWPDAESAKKAGRLLVQERLAACTNILPGMTSIYEWEGQIQESQETIAIFKTTEMKREKLTERIRAAHPYERPCILVLPVADGNPDFLKWIRDQVS